MTVQYVTQAEMDRLLEKQWRARIYVRSCPFRRLLNTAWRRYYKHGEQTDVK